MVIYNSLGRGYCIVRSVISIIAATFNTLAASMSVSHRPDSLALEVSECAVYEGLAHKLIPVIAMSDRRMHLTSDCQTREEIQPATRS